MNPDNNNPFSSTGAGATPSPYGSMSSSNYGAASATSGMGTTGSMSPASDSLTSAADTLNAAAGLNPNGVSAPGYNQYSTSSSDATPQLSVSEGPLTPAAPVPGSIGSVTSVPPVATPESSAMPTFAPAGSTTGSYDNTTTTGVTSNTATSNNMFTPATGTTTSATPAADATTAANSGMHPYNPFAKDTNKAAHTTAAGATSQQSATGASTPSAAMNAAKATAGAKGNGGKQPSKLMIILGVALAITTITTVVFIILYIQALNSSKTIQVPPMANNNNVTTSSVKNLTCTQEATNAEGGATVNELIAKYVDNNLDTITLSTTDNYGTPEAAQSAQDAFISQREARLSIAGISEEPFTVSYNIEPSDDISVLKYSISAKADQLNASNAESAFGGFTTVDGEVDTALESIRNNYESVGYVCEESQCYLVLLLI